MKLKKASKQKARPFLLPDKIVWLNRGWQNAYIGFCPSERAYYAMLKELGVALGRYPSHDGDNFATTSIFTSPTQGRTLVVTICSQAEKAWKKNPAGVAAAFAHEATHVWQEVLDKMGERTRVSAEVEAYSIEALVRMLIDAWLDTRVLRKPLKKKWK